MSSSSLGPCGGPAVLQRLTWEMPTPLASLEERKELFATVLSANPSYLPGVASGAVSFEAWYHRKSPEWVLTGRTPAISGLAVHGAVRLNGALPTGELLETQGAPRLSWELGMLVVRPGVRGCGLASALIAKATEAFAGQLWTCVHRGSAGEALLRKLGWQPSIPMSWPGDPLPGLVLVSPTARPFAPKVRGE